MQELYLDEISLVVGMVGVLVILWGILLGFVQLVSSEIYRLRGQDTQSQREELRQHVGYYLSLSLEFLIAADIIHTILQPSLQELAVLGAIVAIRTVISFSLSWELSQSERRSG